jgi:hypothetical protein
MGSQLLFPIVLMALFGGYTLWMWKKRSAGMGPAFRTFFERTGYRYAELPATTPLEQQVAHGEMLAKRMSADMRAGGYKTHMVRDFHGQPIHWETWTKSNDKGWSMGCSWSAPLAGPARVRIQIADKSLSGVGKAVKEMFSNSERVWEAAFPHKVATGDDELDKRFMIYVEDPAAVGVIAATPGLRELLLGCTEVDLTVAGAEVRFADPLQKNLRAGLGGTLGQMAIASDLSKQMELSIPVHERICELLAVTARAVA